MSKDMRHLKYKCCAGLESSPESYKGDVLAESCIIMKYERKLHEYVRNHFQRTCNGLAVFWPTMDLAEI